MRVLYGIQGTGHGHISRAREILPVLSNHAEVDVLVSGYNCTMNLEDVDVTYRRGISLAYDSNGGVSMLQTAFKLNPIRFLNDVRTLSIDRYDLIISDYEPITAWAAASTGRHCVGLSHQAAFLSEKSPRPAQRSLFAENILRRFAPSAEAVGFHFKRYDSFIEPPIIRSQIRELKPVTGSHITVYLPAFDHETLAAIFRRCREVEWHVFSPLCRQPYTKGNVTVRPVGNLPFLESLEASLGVLTSAGFETCAESMYLGKKLMVVPIKNQYEQLCNAAALRQMGVPVATELGESFFKTIQHWLNNTKPVLLHDIADAESITQTLLQKSGDLVHA
ncbi:MAG: glycosyltransferase family protein [Balneolaceae bacterium]